MPYGKLTPEQRSLVQQEVTGLEVLDLGSGDLKLAQLLLRLGARKVIAVDKERYTPIVEPGLKIIQSTFADFEKSLPEGRSFDMAFLAWPANRHLPGLIPLLSRCRNIIYLGSNVGGHSCGDKTLFQYLQQCELVHYLPDPRNSLAVYGQHVYGYSGLPDDARHPTGEEYAAITGELLSFTEAEKLAEQRRLTMDTQSLENRLREAEHTLADLKEKMKPFEEAFQRTAKEWLSLREDYRNARLKEMDARGVIDWSLLLESDPHGSCILSHRLEKELQPFHMRNSGYHPETNQAGITITCRAFDSLQRVVVGVQTLLPHVKPLEHGYADFSIRDNSYFGHHNLRVKPDLSEVIVFYSECDQHKFSALEEALRYSLKRMSYAD